MPSLWTNYLLHSLLDSSHGGSYEKREGMTPPDQQQQLFGQLNFPVTSETDAWKEKVSFSISNHKFQQVEIVASIRKSHIDKI